MQKKFFFFCKNHSSDALLPSLMMGCKKFYPYIFLRFFFVLFNSMNESCGARQLRTSLLSWLFLVPSSHHTSVLRSSICAHSTMQCCGWFCPSAFHEWAANKETNIGHSLIRQWWHNKKLVIHGNPVVVCAHHPPIRVCLLAIGRQQWCAICDAHNSTSSWRSFLPLTVFNRQLQQWSWDLHCKLPVFKKSAKA